MKHLFAPYNIALLAKEKEFDEDCLAMYWESNDLTFHMDSPEHNCLKRNSEIQNKNINAPLYQQLIDWFSIKKIDILVYQIQPFEGELRWIACICDHRSGKLLKGEVTFINHNIPDKAVNHWEDKYEALNKALEEAFKMI